MKPGHGGPPREEPNRFLGFPVGTGRPAGAGNPGGAAGSGKASRAARTREESQRFMGFPVDWFGSVELGQLSRLAHPTREYRRWVQRRRSGPDEIQPDTGRRGSG